MLHCPLDSVAVPATKDLVTGSKAQASVLEIVSEH